MSYNFMSNGIFLPLHHQTREKMVKRWTVGLSHFSL